MQDPKPPQRSARDSEIFARIAALHRALADSYEQLARPAAKSARLRRAARRIEPPARPETTERQRGALRRKGILL